MYGWKKVKKKPVLGMKRKVRTANILFALLASAGYIPAEEEVDEDEAQPSQINRDFVEKYLRRSVP